MRFFPKCPRDREELIDGVIAGGNGGGLVFCEILERAQRAVQAIDLGLMERELRVHGAGDEVDGLDEVALRRFGRWRQVEPRQTAVKTR